MKQNARYFRACACLLIVALTAAACSASSEIPENANGSFAEQLDAAQRQSDREIERLRADLEDARQETSQARASAEAALAEAEAVRTELAALQPELSYLRELEQAVLESEAEANRGGISAPLVELEYWLWDGNQQPAYEECANLFMDRNPDIVVNVTQFGWGDYWDGLTLSFATDSGPDVFTNHLARFPEQIELRTTEPLNLYTAAETLSDTYHPGLIELWTDPSGDLHGIPKDFDTIAVFANEDLLADAGVRAQDLANLTWNPDDGGSFGTLIKRLSIDGSGTRGDSPDFDPTDVAVYGFGLEGNFGAFGQTTFSSFAASNGWVAGDAPWASTFNYDQPELAETMQWFANWIEAGYISPLDEVFAFGGTTMFQSGQTATMTNGSWMINFFDDSNEFPTVFAPTPVGPSGSRASMISGLADSINAATSHPDESAAWVNYLGGLECQEIVATYAVVMPAIPSATAVAELVYAENGLDISAFTTHVYDGTTVPYPTNLQPGAIEALLNPVMEAILEGDVDAATALAEVAPEVNALFDS